MYRHMDLFTGLREKGTETFIVVGILAFFGKVSIGLQG